EAGTGPGRAQRRDPRRTGIRPRPDRQAARPASDPRHHRSGSSMTSTAPETAAMMPHKRHGRAPTIDAVRRAVPSGIPVTVRISATDWVPDSNTEDDAVEISRAFTGHGAAAIDVSSGQVTKDEKPAFGRTRGAGGIQPVWSGCPGGSQGQPMPVTCRAV